MALHCPERNVTPLWHDIVYYIVDVSMSAMKQGITPLETSTRGKGHQPGHDEDDGRIHLIPHNTIPVNQRRSAYACSMMGQRRRRCPNINQA